MNRPSVNDRPLAISAGEQSHPTTLGRYEIYSRLSSESLGRVYTAGHTTLKRRVVIKVLPSFCGQDVSRIMCFTREMEAVAQIEHPNIARVIDAGEEDGTHYVAMEFVDGLDLQRLVKREKRLEPAVACEIIRQAAVGLQHIQERGLVHRDLKPTKLMIARNGTVKVLGLGIAKIRTEDGTDTETETGNFGAPKHERDRDSADIRADIYSLGCILYWMIGGRVPSDSTHATQASKTLDEPQSGPSQLSNLDPDLPPELIGVVNRMMANNQDERFQTPAEVVAAMCNWANGERLPVLVAKHVATPTATWKRPAGYSSHSRPNPQAKSSTIVEPESKRVPVLSLAAAIIFAALGVGAYVLSHGMTPPSTPAPRPTLVETSLPEIDSKELAATALSPENSSAK